MTKEENFVELFLEHAGMTPIQRAAYNKEYYLRTRKLKGRKAGTAKAADPRSNISYNGNPLKKPGTRMEEDETPEVSPTGAKLVDYDGKGLGKATYADGNVYDAAVGWKKAGQEAVTSARAQNNANRAKNGIPKVANRRIGAAEQKIIRAKTLAKRVKDPSDRAALLKKIQAAERKLKSVKTRTGSSIKPVLRKKGGDV